MSIEAISKEHADSQNSWPEVTDTDRLWSFFGEYERVLADQGTQANTIKGCVTYSKLSFEQWCQIGEGQSSEITIGLVCHPVINGQIIHSARNETEQAAAIQLHAQVDSVLNAHGFSTNKIAFDKQSFMARYEVIYPDMKWQKRRNH